jgi:uncharacterized protein
LEHIYLILLGTVIGLSTAFLGLGGGLFIVPLLTLIYPMPPSEVIATSICSIFFVVLLNSYRFYRQGLVQKNIAIIMGPVTGLAAYIAAKLSVRLEEIFLQYLFIVVLFMVFFLIYTKKKTDKGTANTEKTTENFDFNNRSVLLSVMMWALVAGGVSGLTGIGSGLILGGYFMKLKYMDSHKITPTTNAVMLWTTFFGMISFLNGSPDFNNMQWGYVHFGVSIELFLSGMFVASIFTKYQHLVTNILRRRLLLIIVFILALKSVLVL